MGLPWLTFDHALLNSCRFLASDWSGSFMCICKQTTDLNDPKFGEWTHYGNPPAWLLITVYWRCCFIIEEVQWHSLTFKLSISTIQLINTHFKQSQSHLPEDKCLNITLPCAKLVTIHISSGILTLWQIIGFCSLAQLFLILKKNIYNVIYIHLRMSNK